ncbi:MAG: hypothetical protein M1818_004940 [Claussenomyces sp. TS43310]|nr:MAG: hypothetical protein M1818_004940 [Claussenomyces sp. TS43310]
MAAAEMWQGQAAVQAQAQAHQQVQHPQDASMAKNGRRRQHRSCDQCRRSKRACDVVVPDGQFVSNRQPAAALGPPYTPAASPTDPLGGSSADVTTNDVRDHRHLVAVNPCSSCARGKKLCTLKWLGAQQGLIAQRLKHHGSAKPGHGRRPVDRMSNKLDRQRGASKLSDGPTLSTSSIHSTPEPHHDALLSSSVFLECSTIPPRVGDVDLLTAPATLDNAVFTDCHFDEGDPWRHEQEHPSWMQDLNANGGLSGHFDIYDAMGGSGVAPLPGLPNMTFDANTHASSATSNQSPRSNLTSRTTPPFQRHSTLDSTQSTFYDSELPLKSRRGSASSRDAFSACNDPSSDAPQYRLAQSANRSYLTSNLLGVYHDSMENALSCWLTERTCPYNARICSLVPHVGRDDVESMGTEWGPNWSNRIFTRVCRLDRASSAMRTRPLTSSEDQAASRALQAAVMAFASQWAQSSPRNARKAAALIDNSKSMDRSAAWWNGGVGSTAGFDSDLGSPMADFERSMQETCWHKARQALNDTAGIESFRVIFAHIIFSLTLQPLDVEQQMEKLKLKRQNPMDLTSPYGTPFSEGSLKSGSTITRLAELDQLLEMEGPPLFLETALRQIFSYRCKLEKIERKRSAQMRRSQVSLGMENAAFSSPGRADPLNVEDRKTFDLLFWLAIMFDTISAAMNNRPVVVSDEDSSINNAAPREDPRSLQNGVYDHMLLSSQPNSYPSIFANENNSKLWGNFFFNQTRHQADTCLSRWPCSYEAAAATLSNAAPIKVLLFRKVAHLQTLLSRMALKERVEETIQDALNVYHYWNEVYGPFMLDCVANHDTLPPRIQSWYSILAGHWHLGGLLLAEMIESVDEVNMGLESQRSFRQSSHLVDQLQKQNAYALSDLARCSSPNPDSSFPVKDDFHFAVNAGSLLTEPWTIVLIRSFGLAGYVLLKHVPFHGRTQPGHPREIDESDNNKSARRCSWCIEALWHLGKKSDMALLAATALSTSLRDKINGPA